MSDREEAQTSGTTDDRSSLARAWEIVRYAPIGILLDGPAQLPRFAERGKVHVRNARFLGELVVRQGGQQLRAWLDDGNGEAGRTEDVSQPSAATQQETSEKQGTSEPSLSPTAADLAIPGYEDLPASDIVTRLSGLTREELEAVRVFEAAHRGRKTVLNKVAQIRS